MQVSRDENHSLTASRKRYRNMAPKDKKQTKEDENAQKKQKTSNAFAPPSQDSSSDSEASEFNKFMDDVLEKTEWKDRMERKQAQQSTSSSSFSQAAELMSGLENKALFAKFFAEHKKTKHAKMIQTSNAFTMLDETTTEWKIKGMKKSYATKREADATLFEKDNRNNVSQTGSCQGSLHEVANPT